MPEDEFSESAARLRARNEDGPMVPAIADRRWRDPMTITPSTEPVRSLLPLSVDSGTNKANVNALAYRTVGKISPTLKNVKLSLSWPPSSFCNATRPLSWFFNPRRANQNLWSGLTFPAMPLLRTEQ